MTALWIVVKLALREAQRRRVLWLVAGMGLLFLAVFAAGFHFVAQDVAESRLAPDQALFPYLFLTLAGLYVTNFLIVVVSVLISVAGISAEIENHTLEVLVTKPIFRWQLLLGKWLAYALLIGACILLLPGGIILFVYLRAGFGLQNVATGLGLMYLAGLTVMTLSLFGGTRLSTLANGALAFMLYGLAFLGGWVEQIGALLENETAVDLGILASLILPVDILWKKASALFAPPTMLTQFNLAGPFAVSSQPSDLMIGYALVYLLVLLLLAVWSIHRRDL